MIINIEFVDNGYCVCFNGKKKVYIDPEYLIIDIATAVNTAIYFERDMIAEKAKININMLNSDYCKSV